MLETRYSRDLRTFIARLAIAMLVCVNTSLLAFAIKETVDNSGGLVGEVCHKQYFDPAGFTSCINDYCISRPTYALQYECIQKAMKQASELQESEQIGGHHIYQ